MALRLAAALIAAVLVTSVIASIISSQFVVAGLQEVGATVSINDRLSLTMRDLGIIKALAILVAVCFIIGFTIAGFASRQLGGNRTVWYLAAGFFAFITTLLIMAAVLQLMPIAGARTDIGLICMGIAGAIGGWTFARLSEQKPNS